MVDWNYTDNADITLGDVPISKTSKILLIIIVIILTIIATLSIIFRKQIMAYISNPHIILSDKQVDLEIGEQFDVKSIILNENQGYTYTVDGLDLLDTNKVGSYDLIYKSKNDFKSHTESVKINVIDSEPPTITLISDMISLERGEETKQFNPKDYIKSVTDNYSDTENIRIDYTKSIDFDKETAIVEYSAIDEQGNVGKKALNIAISSSEKEIKDELEKREKEITAEAEKAKLEAERAKEEAEQAKKEAEEQLKENKDNKDKKDKKDKKDNNSSNSNNSNSSSNSNSNSSNSSNNSNSSSSNSSSSNSSSNSTSNSNNTTKKDTTKKDTTKKDTTKKDVEESDAIVKKVTPYIKGVHDVTVLVGTDAVTLVTKLTKGIKSSGTITCNYSKVDLSTPGTYKAYFTSNDGVSKKCTVKVNAW